MTRFGLNVHGAIDGFSRYILWLRVCRSNRDPLIVANFFVDWIIENNFVCPYVVRTDRGTENQFILGFQAALRDQPGEVSWMTGPSTSNQRIEASGVYIFL